MTIAWVRPDGSIIKTASDDSNSPNANAVAVSPAPDSGEQIWDFVTKTWSVAPLLPSPPLTAEELYDMLVAKSVVTNADRPRSR